MNNYSSCVSLHLYIQKEKEGEEERGERGRETLTERKSNGIFFFISNSLVDTNENYEYYPNLWAIAEL